MAEADVSKVFLDTDEFCKKKLDNFLYLFCGTTNTMAVSDKLYPKRVFIKYKAKEKLGMVLAHNEVDEQFDEDLFSEITAIFFRNPINQKFAYPCNTRDEANDIATIIGAKIAEIYLQIKARQKSNLVQDLNALL